MAEGARHVRDLQYRSGRRSARASTVAMAYTVTQRTREIGVRLAIGATPGDVLRLVVGQTARIAAGGLVIGVFAALLLTRLLRGLLFGVTPLDPATFVLASAALLGVAVLAGYLPARRAAAIDPLSAIREA